MRNWYFQPLVIVPMTLALTLPMRNWYFGVQLVICIRLGLLLPYLWGIDTSSSSVMGLPPSALTLPMRNWYDAWPWCTDRARRSYLTYEELILCVSFLLICLCFGLLPYLWGIDTYVHKRHANVEVIDSYLTYEELILDKLLEDMKSPLDNSYLTYEELIPQ